MPGPQTAARRPSRPRPRRHRGLRSRRGSTTAHPTRVRPTPAVLPGSSPGPAHPNRRSGAARRSEPPHRSPARSCPARSTVPATLRTRRPEPRRRDRSVGLRRSSIPTTPVPPRLPARRLRVVRSGSDRRTSPHRRRQSAGEPPRPPCASYRPHRDPPASPAENDRTAS